MKNILVYDWVVEGKKENPYYYSVDKNKFSLEFTEKSIHLIDIDFNCLDGFITHYSPSAFIIKFSKVISERNFPVIQYRSSPNDLKKGIEFFKVCKVPLKNLYQIQTPEELGILLRKIF
ncbi:MAG: hypothetical protein KKB62_00690 [Nanoarchaeota archaeon]|nr:hypothetical protein [Nanoarchaeota archaeon]